MWHSLKTTHVDMDTGIRWCSGSLVWLLEATMPNSSAPVHTESNSKQIVYKDIPFYMPFDFKIVKKIFAFQK